MEVVDEDVEVAGVPGLDDGPRVPDAAGPGQGDPNLVTDASQLDVSAVEQIVRAAAGLGFRMGESPE
jgi:hypothetical protein